MVTNPGIATPIIDPYGRQAYTYTGDLGPRVTLPPFGGGLAGGIFGGSVVDPSFILNSKAAEKLLPEDFSLFETINQIGGERDSPGLGSPDFGHVSAVSQSNALGKQGARGIASSLGLLSSAPFGTIGALGSLIGSSSFAMNNPAQAYGLYGAPSFEQVQAAIDYDAALRGDFSGLAMGPDPTFGIDPIGQANDPFGGGTGLGQGDFGGGTVSDPTGIGDFGGFGGYDPSGGGFSGGEGGDGGVGDSSGTGDSDTGGPPGGW